ncbi:pyruvate dehydrogenase (acetyl-transferring) E1 component subunit alpha [Salinilacihabitans rarus]|uniref:pyruvate dehydrogenase (acetyl-transferring) E1 component subunit alpha n=1 Tax=Salinilacihabitans rarus TaxID=2961596 RepID=UPI0020C83354|nr:pyruvate dehydrogenase (acetyl-transferring) E1 component subunit alpha [Salinilacihabitans rarus]
MSSPADDIVRVVPSDGDPDARSTDVPEADLLRCYETQVLARTFDEKAISLHRQGRIGTYAPMRGQEGAQVGAALALCETDYLFPTYRDHAMYLARGLPPAAVVRHLLGRGNYVDRWEADVAERTFPITIPIATQLPHAVGVGMAADYAGDDCVALASLGDGATSEGDFHEALNVAGVFEAPAVFFCQNNGWAISVPRERQTASATIAGKAEAYGIEGVRVDGNDPVAVYDVVREAIERARDGGGPTLIEAVTYRKGPHTTTDDPSRYRDEDEPEEWPDPIERTRTYLERTVGWTDADDEALRERARTAVEEAVEAAEAEADPDPATLFDHVHSDGHPRYERQRERLPEAPRSLDG